MKTTILAGMFALGVGFAAMPAASAAEGGATLINSKAASNYTLTFDARRHCRMREVCKRHWHPHCKLVRICVGG